MNLRRAISFGMAALNSAGIDGAGRDVRALLSEAVNLPAARLSLEPDREVDASEMARFEALIARRARHEPVSRILGRRAFWGRDFIVTDAVLDPRPETESLIAEALEGPASERLLDLGTGSGAIAVTLLAEWPEAVGLATDVSDAALKVAQDNADLFGVSDRLACRLSDWFDSVHGAFDLIVSNPPYITQAEMAGLAPDVALFDPLIALSPGGDGLAAYREIAANVSRHLTTGGRVLVEIGWKQGADVAGMMAAAGLSNVRVLQDLDGRDRVVCARKT